ncbi:MAG: Holliday junction resolvase RuvX [Candidatus Bostrichicola ureolyticus]|nr:MAG: Holliday junction resolvase RuvX [Candidatus Bostrichicola ureolyticus]WGH27363.1 MAG: Holliday junction resolvase RuvX [Candidatus Bostrichicola ureolyticus]
MSKILGIDYGRKRTGIAITDPLEIIAYGLETINTEKLMLFIKEYLYKEEIKKIVIGLPKQLNGKYAPIEIDIRQFIKLINQKYNHIIIKRIDERFTSKLAKQYMIEGGLNKKKRKNKTLINKISATLILQSYLLQKDNLL